jgi:hypothetical protein
MKAEKAHKKSLDARWLDSRAGRTLVQRVRGVYFYKKQNRLLPLLIFFKDAIFFKKIINSTASSFHLGQVKMRGLAGRAR